MSFKVNMNRAGDYDPVHANLYRPDRTESNGEPLAGFAFDRRRPLRVLAGYTREFVAQNQQRENSTNVFRLRRHSDAETLDGQYIMEWRGRWYEFTGVNYPNLYEIEVYTTITDRRPTPIAIPVP